ncbi:EpsG family protein [Klebsiella sp. BIGb0407]|uniref:EpsG family protein n=1 Tax=Klebsiella sp. BIGb0407 TaxID=2940603 RepID=UPI002167598B|nr:EpsG family protein [Klebsiella sp. BIGb0407]MCS3430538.1 hypothetical protein [Klebsiella sp. BIGb0407]
MKIKKNNLYILVCVLLLFIFSIITGLRTDSFDYSEYVVMIRNTMKGESLIDKIFLAKDPLFGLIVGVINPVYEYDYKYVFLTISILGFIGKLFFLNKIKDHVFYFLIIYIILLSPSLDYAAIRSMVGLSFLGAALAYYNNGRVQFLILSTIAMLSHISIIVPFLLSLKIVNKFIIRFKYLIFVVLTITIPVLGKLLLSQFSNSQTYLNINGSIFAIVPPLICVLTSILYWKVIMRKMDAMQIDDFNKITFYISFVILYISFLLSPVVVVASFRLMQIGQFLFLLTLCSTNIKNRSTVTKVFFYLITILYSIPFVFRNIQLDLWSNILENL